MSKAMLVTLPFVLLLLDFWPLQRLGYSTVQRLFAEKIPFFLLAAISCVVTFLVQRHAGAVQAFTDSPLEMRIENSIVSYARYLGKAFWPVGLATPYSDVRAWPPIIFGTAAIFLLAVSFWAVYARRKFPFVFMG
jgi:protein O-mannosyl-transferase